MYGDPWSGYRIELELCKVVADMWGNGLPGVPSSIVF